MMRRVLLTSVLITCAASAASRAQAPPEEPGVFAAVLRQQLQEQLDETARADGTVICVAFDPGGAPQNPSAALLRPFAAEKRLRRVGECDRRPEGAVEGRTLRPAVIVTVGPIDWVAADEAHVEVSLFRSARSGAHRKYRVVREPSGWVSLGQIIRDGPL